MTDLAPARTEPLHLADAAATLDELWSPRVAGRVNDVLVKISRVEGDFVWHDHPDTDEAFLCLAGRLDLDLRDENGERTVTLEPGAFFVVPRGQYHRPHSAGGASIALFEAAGTVNTGGVTSELTAPVDRPL